MDLCNEKYQVILTDLFDTLLLRDVTAKGVVNRWAVCLKKRFKCLNGISTNTLVSMRRKAFLVSRKKAETMAFQTGKSEVDYVTAIGKMFDEISECAELDKNEFIEASMQIDVSVECGCDYVDKSYLKTLLKAKECGKKIYCVSDYYLPADELRKIMYAIDIPKNLFDGIFVSCDVGKRKATGDIYPYVLEQLKIDPSTVIMVGDSKSADYVNARKAGIDAMFRPNYAYKCAIYGAEKMGSDYSKKQMKESTDRMYRDGADYSEYIAIFYVFIKRLYAKLSEEGISEIAFMAREGYYLRELFETYQKLLHGQNQQIKTTYYWCSRRSIMAGVEEEHTSQSLEDITINNWLKSLQIGKEDIRKFVSFTDDELEVLQPLKKSRIYKELNSNSEFQKIVKDLIKENHDAFITYTMPYVKDGVFRFVDSGWKCTSQNAIEKWYGIKTKGYYIGVQIPDKPILELDCQGLIFSEQNPKSRYYDYLGMNIPFYQQLLAAPHGTALKYVGKEDGIEILHEWDPIEQELFESRIEKLQEYMMLKFRGLAAWDDTEPNDPKIDWLIAKLSMRSSLFAHGTRLEFIRHCTENYVQNFRQENRGKVQYDIKNVKIGPDAIWKPEKLIRYVSKVQRTSAYNHKIVKIVYPVFSHCFYAYVLLVHRVRK